MALADHDRVFLKDYVQCNWMQRILTARALFEAGTTERADSSALAPMRLTNPRKNDAELLEIMENVNERARVQAVLTVRVFGEFFGALEDAGAFLRAIRVRQTGGILQNNFEYAPSQVRSFYEEIRRARGPRGAWALLRFPDLRHTRRLRGIPLYDDLRTLQPRGGKVMRQAATTYLVFPKSQLLPINTGRLHKHWNRLVHILVGMGAPVRKTRGLLEITHNKIKHGFNVLEGVPTYVKLPKAPVLSVVKVGMSMPDMRVLVNNIENIALLCHRVAQSIVLLDDEGAWR
jgi:hypothetical protein